ncbi:fbce27ad-6756-4acd-a1e6-d75bddeb6d3d [Sclerotinia trifoliorum]|uniref:Fbce27ad-6756-4acd-a1e6-d75bddeb6d3d n=1 Tax=Sclerotinia trifoliorum TaxID=28548 RepID=A0A8H2W419_9HELO|nr:fbce27ad-6756-4acd-a1e6-d75bddeb6d3d [Sclerotinia trifoliorum]
MTPTSIVGSTGLVGSHILNTLLSHPSISTIHSLSRRSPQEPAATSPKLSPLISEDTKTWSLLLSSTKPPPTIFFSALGTTKAQAGSIEAQRKIDLELNLELARTFANLNTDSQSDETTNAPKSKIYVLISTHGANSSSRIPYSKMKGELEDGVMELKDSFKHVVILRPGLIVGERSDSRPAEFALRKVAGWVGWLGVMGVRILGAGCEGCARAAVNAGLRAQEGKMWMGVIPKVWVLGQADIVRLGREEWKGE